MKKKPKLDKIERVLSFFRKTTFTYHDVEKEAGGENGGKVILVEGDVGRGSEDGKVRLEANAWKI